VSSIKKNKKNQTRLSVNIKMAVFEQKMSCGEGKEIFIKCELSLRELC